MNKKWYVLTFNLIVHFFAFPQPVINNNIYIFHNIDNLIKYIIITIIMSQIEI